jgi:hypothetical protein
MQKTPSNNIYIVDGTQHQPQRERSIRETPPEKKKPAGPLAREPRRLFDPSKWPETAYSKLPPHFQPSEGRVMLTMRRR